VFGRACGQKFLVLLLLDFICSIFLHEWIPGHVVKNNSTLDERTYHSRYFGKSRSICHTFSLGASIKMDAETEKTPFEDGGGRFEDVDIQL
jgi:hypothetical protein